MRIDLGGGAHALFTTRGGGASSGAFASLNLGRTTPEGDADDPAHVERNRDAVAAQAGVALARFASSHQVHGARVREVGEPDGWPVATLEHEADGMITRERDLALVVLVADCLPVALAGDDGVAMLHGGWRGLAGGILGHGVQALGGAHAAAIGPGIGPCCFEVGDEVREAFAEHPEARHGRNLDLKAIARAQLEALGLGQIHDVGRCTACEPDAFFSHRRDGAQTGRQGGVAWRAT